MFHSLKLVSSDLDYINTPYQPIQVLRLIVHKKRFGIRYKVLIDISCGYCFEWTSHFLINYIKSNLDYLDWHIISYSWLMTIWMSQMALWDFFWRTPDGTFQDSVRRPLQTLLSSRFYIKTVTYSNEWIYINIGIFGRGYGW